MKKTAVQWLIEQLNEQGFLGTYCTPDNIDTKRESMNQIIEQAKEMENQQIINAYIDGINSDCMSHEDSVGYANEYYNQTFNK